MMTRPARGGDPVVRLVGRRTRELFAAYPKALIGDVEAVHDLRVAARRMRAVVRVLMERPAGKIARRADRRLKRLARAAGTGRDMDVAVEVLATLSPAGAASRPDWTALTRSLAASRARARRKTREALLDLHVAGLRHDLRRLEAIDSVDPAALAGRVRAVVQAEGVRLRARLAAAGRRFDPAALHEIRRLARRLRYAAEIADALLGRESGAPRTWRALQNRLGDIHDRHMLAAWLGRRAERAERRGEAALAATARAAASRSIRDARRRHRELLADDPSALVEGALAAMGPTEEPGVEGPTGRVVPFAPAAAG